MPNNDWIRKLSVDQAQELQRTYPGIPVTQLAGQSQQAIDLLKSKEPEFEDTQTAAFGLKERRRVGIEALKNPAGIPLITPKR